jgi:hypothetical protein
MGHHKHQAGYLIGNGATKERKMSISVYRKLVGLGLALTIVSGQVIVRASEPTASSKKPVRVTKQRATSSSSKSRVKRKKFSAQNDAEVRAKALKRLNDYNYVKQNFGLGGATYSPTKW